MPTPAATPVSTIVGSIYVLQWNKATNTVRLVENPSIPRLWGPEPRHRECLRLTQRHCIRHPAVLTIRATTTMSAATGSFVRSQIVE